MIKTIILGVGIFAALLAVLIFSGKLPIGNSAAKPQGEVVLWGTLPETDMNDVIMAFNPKAKTYRVTYRQIKEETFSQTLVEALANGAGPDMILAPHQIILSQSSRLYTFPVSTFSEKSYKDMYVDGASLFFTPQGAIAFPVSIEPMVLFYNRTMLAKHGIANPPQYWDQVSQMVPQITILSNQNKFIESAIDLGAPNTPYAKDILMAIVNQLGQAPVLKLYNPDSSYFFSVTANEPTTEGGEILPLTTATRFFSEFADPTKTTYTWNEYAGSPSDQFVAEKLAMYVGYSGELNTLKSRNPKADYEMTFLPQTRGNNFSTGARMYAIATLKSSKNLTASLAVQSQFAGSEISTQIASIIGAVPALRAYIGTPGLNDIISRSMLVARGWYDLYPEKSISYTYSMLSDIINNRYGVTDAVQIFVSRMQDLYTPH
jgi:ABC-type glycerol-3-phosphate transport system substrate-binding protein